MNRVFKGSIAPLPFWQGDAGLSFVALFESVCGVAASGLKVRYGPFVSLSMGTVLFDTVEIYEGGCVVL